MKTIWKFNLNIEDEQKVVMPKDAKILTAQMQKDTLCLWALVDTDITVIDENRYIGIYGTGNPIPAPENIKKYISTFQLHDGGLIFHIFELNK